MAFFLIPPLGPEAGGLFFCREKPFLGGGGGKNFIKAQGGKRLAAGKWMRGNIEITGAWQNTIGDFWGVLPMKSAHPKSGEGTGRVLFYPSGLGKIGMEVRAWARFWAGTVGGGMVV